MTTELPLTMPLLPTTESVPVVTTTEIPTTVPVTNTPVPVTNTPVPVTNTPVPVTTTSVPQATTPNPVTVATDNNINLISLMQTTAFTTTTTRTPVPYVIFGIYPNGTVFRKLPNSSVKVQVHENEIARRNPYFPPTANDPSLAQSSSRNAPQAPSFDDASRNEIPQGNSQQPTPSAPVPTPAPGFQLGNMIAGALLHQHQHQLLPLALQLHQLLLQVLQLHQLLPLVLQLHQHLPLVLQLHQHLLLALQLHQLLLLLLAPQLHQHLHQQQHHLRLRKKLSDS
ncbi:hypothetical protein L9F63_024292, partial [Diploptera punctata]